MAVLIASTMLRFGPIAFASALLLGPAVYAGSPRAGQNAPQSAPIQSQPSGDQGPPPTLRHVAPDSQTDEKPPVQNGSANPAGAAVQPEPASQASTGVASSEPIVLPANAPPLREESRLQIIRYVSGEFAKVVTPLPGGKKGFHFKAGASPDQDSLRRALTADGASLNVGDSVQITKIEFHGREIQFDINGGPKGHTSWRQRIHLEGGLGLPVSTGTTTTPQDTPVVVQKGGATIFLDFDGVVPDMTADQLKGYLARVLDFSKQRSAAVAWVDSLPAPVREAIAAKRAEVGMDHDEVTAAMGRPERKVRERDADGNDTEDWIYGTPPAKTIFVTFQGDKVVKVTQYP
jgi:hypothetical protein